MFLGSEFTGRCGNCGKRSQAPSACDFRMVRDGLHVRHQASQHDLDLDRIQPEQPNCRASRCRDRQVGRDDRRVNRVESGAGGGDADGAGLVDRTRAAPRVLAERRNPDPSGDPDEPATGRPGHVSQCSRRDPARDFVVQCFPRNAPTLGSGDHRRGDCRVDVAGRVEASIEEGREAFEVIDPTAGHRALDPRRVSMAAGWEPPIGQEQQRRSSVHASEEEVPLGHGQLFDGSLVNGVAVDPDGEGVGLHADVG